MSLVVFVGVIGSGKTYRCSQLVNQGYKKISVSDALRDFMWRIVNWSPQTVKDYDDFKLHQFKSQELADFDVTGRQMIQNLAETAKYYFGSSCWSDIWAREVEKELQLGGRVCTEDMRFPSEIDSAVKLGAKFIYCDYRSERYNPNDLHISEKMAQLISGLGKYKDGDEVDLSDLKQFYGEFRYDK